MKWLRGRERKGTGDSMYRQLSEEFHHERKQRMKVEAAEGSRVKTGLFFKDGEDKGMFMC